MDVRIYLNPEPAKGSLTEKVIKTFDAEPDEKKCEDYYSRIVNYTRFWRNEYGVYYRTHSYLNDLPAIFDELEIDSVSLLDMNTMYALTPGIYKHKSAEGVVEVFVPQRSMQRTCKVEINAEIFEDAVDLFTGIRGGSEKPTDVWPINNMAPATRPIANGYNGRRPITPLAQQNERSS